MANFARETLIRNIKGVNEKVAISGILVLVENGFCLVDDGTSTAKVFFQDLNFPLGSYVRIFGIVLSLNNGIEIQGDLVQDLSKIDKTLHRRVKELLE